MREEEFWVKGQSSPYISVDDVAFFYGWDQRKSNRICPLSLRPSRHLGSAEETDLLREKGWGGGRIGAKSLIYCA